MTNQVNYDPTVGGSKTFQGTSQVLRDEDNDFPGAFVESSPTGAAEGATRSSSEAQVVKEPLPSINPNDDGLDEFTRRLASIETEQPVGESVREPAVPQQSATEPEVVSLPSLDEVDSRYLNIQEDDLGIPALPPYNPTDEEFVQLNQLLAKKTNGAVQSYEQILEFLEGHKNVLKDNKTYAQKAQQQIIQEQQSNIKKSWGVDDAEYTRRMSQVVDYFGKLNKTQQAIIDADPNGALIIWDHLERQKQALKPNVPQFQKSRSTNMSTTPDFVFKQSEIDRLSPEKRRALHQQIQQAYRLGLVDKAG